jgi:hypothetical protein
MTQWQKVNLMRSITESNLRDAKGTLISITRLVARIKEMVINKEVRSDVEGAVNALQKVKLRIFPFRMFQTTYLLLVRISWPSAFRLLLQV